MAKNKSGDNSTSRLLAMHTHFVKAVRSASLAAFAYFLVDKQEAELNRK